MAKVIYAEIDDHSVILKDIIGESRTFKSVFIYEVNIPAVKLVLRKA
jgi:predicted RNA-binding protein